MSAKPETLEAAQLRIEELENELARLKPPEPADADREAKILRRMTAGKISRAVAEMAVDHQEIEDGKRLKSRKK